MVRRRGLQYSIEVKDNFSTSLETLALKLQIVHQQFNALGIGLTQFGRNIKNSANPLSAINRQVKNGRTDLRATVRDYGRLATVLRSVQREGNRAYVTLQKLQTVTSSAKLGRAGVLLSQGFGQAQKNINNTNKGLQKTETFLDRALRVGLRVFAIFFAFRAFRGVVTGLVEAVRQGVLFNAEIQRAEIGIQALIASFYLAVDAQGRLLSNQERFSAAAKESKKQIDLLRIAGLSTAATFEQLLFTFQTALGPGAGAGFDLDQIRELTILISQAATALGLEQNQLAEEIRSLFQATPSARATRLAVLFDTGELKKAKELGQLFELLTSRLEQFRKAGEKSLSTFFTAITNLRDAIRQLLGEALGGFFTNLNLTIKEVSDSIFSIDKLLGKVEINEQALGVVKALNEALNRLLLQVKQVVSELGFEGIGQVLTAGIFLIEKATSLLISAFVLLLDVVVKLQKVLAPVVDLFDQLRGRIEDTDKAATKKLGVSFKSLLTDFLAWVVAALLVSKVLKALVTGFSFFGKAIAKLFAPLVSLFRLLGRGFSAAAFRGLGLTLSGAAASVSVLVASALVLARVFASIGNDILPEWIKNLEIGGRKISEWIDLADTFFDRWLDTAITFWKIFYANAINTIRRWGAQARLIFLELAKSLTDYLSEALQIGPLKNPFLAKASEVLDELIAAQKQGIEDLNSSFEDYRRNALQAYNLAEKERQAREKTLDILRDQRTVSQDLLDLLSESFGTDVLFGPVLESVKDASELIQEMARDAENFERTLRLTSLLQDTEGLANVYSTMLADAFSDIGEQIHKLQRDTLDLRDAAEAVVNALLTGDDKDPKLLQSLSFFQFQLATAEAAINDLQNAAAEKARQRFVQYLQQENAKTKAALQRTEVELNAEEQLLAIRRKYVNQFLPAEKAAAAIKLSQTLAAQAEERRLLALNQAFLEQELDNAKNNTEREAVQRSLLQIKQRQLQVDKEIGITLGSNLLDLKESFNTLNRELNETARDLERQKLLADLPVQITEIGVELRSIQSEIGAAFEKRRQEITQFSDALRGAFVVVPQEFKASLLETFKSLQEQLQALSDTERETLARNLSLYAANVARRQALESVAAEDKISLLRQIEEIEAGVGLSSIRQAVAEYQKQKLELQAQYAIQKRLSEQRVADLQTGYRLSKSEETRKAFAAALLQEFLAQKLALDEFLVALSAVERKEEERKKNLTEAGGVNRFLTEFRDELADRSTLIYDALTTLKDGITDVLGGALTDALFRGEDTLKQRAQSLAESLVQIFINEFIKRKVLGYLFGDLLPGGEAPPATGPWKGGLIRGPGDIGRPSLAHRSAPGYAAGGLPRPAGLHPSDIIPAWLAKGEFVQPVATVKKYGIDFMEALRRGVLDPFDARALLSSQPFGVGSVPALKRAAAQAVPGFAAGGLVTGPFRSRSQQEGSQGLQVVNVFDPDQMVAVLAKGAGKDVIFNLIDARLAQKGM